MKKALEIRVEYQTDDGLRICLDEVIKQSATPTNGGGSGGVGLECRTIYCWDRGNGRGVDSHFRDLALARIAAAEKEIARLDAEVAQLNANVRSARAHARRMVKGRKAAEDRLRAAGLMAPSRNRSPSTGGQP